jgi:hypothetical protein
VLPLNIEELKINEHAPRLSEQLDKFAMVCTELYPKLKLISVSRAELDIDEDSHAEKKLKDKFAELAPDVSFVFEDGSEVDHFEGSIGSASI